MVFNYNFHAFIRFSYDQIHFHHQLQCIFFMSFSKLLHLDMSSNQRMTKVYDRCCHRYCNWGSDRTGFSQDGTGQGNNWRSFSLALSVFICLSKSFQLGVSYLTIYTSMLVPNRRLNFWIYVLQHLKVLNSEHQHSKSFDLYPELRSI